MALDTRVSLVEKDLELLNRAKQDVNLDGQDSIFWGEYERARDTLYDFIQKAREEGMTGEDYRALFSGEKPFYVTEPHRAISGTRFLLTREFYLNREGFEKGKGRKAYRKIPVIFRRAKIAIAA